MSKIDLISGNWSELVFDGRNKAYGAYDLRQKTGNRNMWAALILLLLAVVIWGVLKWKAYSDEQARIAALNEAENKMTEIIQAEEEDVADEKEEEVVYVEEQQEVQQEVMATEAFQVPEIKEDDKVSNEITSTEEHVNSDAAIGFSNEEGTEGATETRHMEAIVTQAPVEVKKPEVEKPFDVVEVMPSFPGGQGELMKYLASNIKYPVVAQENGIQGRVVVKFVVEPDGSISNVVVVKSVDPSLDKEAVRVVKSMPKWIPGQNNGQKVRVNFNVPVSFKLQ